MTMLSMLFTMKREKTKKCKTWRQQTRSNPYHNGDGGVQEACWLAFANFTQTRLAWEDRTSIKGLPPSDCPVGHVCGVLVIDVGGFILMVGSASPGLCKTAG